MSFFTSKNYRKELKHIVVVICKLFFCLFFSFFWLPAYTSSPLINADIHRQWSIKHITVDQGLSYNFVHSICEDRYGYLWFATSNGLNRYNGITVENFFNNNKDTNSLGSNYIWTVFLDSDSLLWIGTKSGLHYYNDQLETFEKVLVPDNINEREVFVIKEDSDKNLLFGTSSGLYTCKTRHKQLRKIDLKEYGAQYDSIYRIEVDKQDNLWMSSYQKGLYYFNRKSNTIKHYRADKNHPDSLSEDWIFDLYIDKENVLWIGTYNSGICKFNEIDSSFTPYVIDKDYEFSKRIRTIFEDKYGRLFIGSRDGLFLFDKQNEKFSLYAHTAHDISKLSQNSVTYSYLDKTGGMWLGTHSGGVNYINMYQKEFTLYSYIQNNTSFLNTGAIHCFAETDNYLYVGSEKGINLKSKHTDKFTYLHHNPSDPFSLTYDDVKAIKVESPDKIWVATNRGGLLVLNSKNKVIESFRHNPKNPYSLPSDNLYDVFLDKKNTPWVLSNTDWDRLNCVLSRYDAKTEKFFHYDYDFFMGFYPSSDSSFFVGGEHGFFKYHYKLDTFLAYKNDSLIYRTMTLFEDKHKNIWIGSTKGLTKYNFQEGAFTDISDGLSYSFGEVYGILEHDNNLWVSTNNGLIVIQNIYGNPSNFVIRKYDKTDGLQSREFNYNAYYKSFNNYMYFGGDNGFNYFHPDSIKDNPYKPKIYISGLAIAGKRIYPGQVVSRKNKTLKASVFHTNSLKIKYNSGAITLYFNAIHYANVEANTYKHKLIGLDEDWSYSNVYNNFVTYHKLPPGDYMFVVYGINSDGIESTSPDTLGITIEPPFWQTLLFKIGIIALIIIMAFILVRNRIYKLKRQRKILQEIVEIKTRQLTSYNKQLKERQQEILNQNEEITTQRDTIQEKSILLEELYLKAKMLNDFGAELTATLNIESIVYIIYNRLKNTVDLTAFGIGLHYNGSIVFNHFIEEGKLLPSFDVLVEDKANCTAHCFNNNETLLIGDVDEETKYRCIINTKTKNKYPSAIYIPLIVNNKHIGIVTFHAVKKNAYTINDLPFIQSIAAFIAIAIDNSEAYKLIAEQNTDLALHKNNLEKLVTERTSDLEKSKLKAEESDKLKSAFLANMSHEIRTPLNAILGFIELLYDDIISETNRKYLNIIRNSSYTLLRLLEDIIDFSRIESGKIDVIIKDINIERILNEQLQSFKQILSVNNKEFEQDVKLELINLKPFPINTLYSDEHKISKIISNLLSNAIKFSHKGMIQFGLENYQNGVYTFYVKDSGIGIEKTDFDIIFKRFSKLEHKTEKLYRGGGLGLSISENLILLLGGTIWLNSELGKGSTFFFSLMSARQSNKERTNDSTKHLLTNKLPNWEGKTFLVVEDEQANYLVIKSILIRTKVKLLHAANGIEGVNLFQQNKHLIDLVLMDIKLPLMSGYKASEEIKKIQGNIPIIAQTAYATAKDKEKIEQSVMDNYITKPFSANQLINKISEQLRKIL